MRSFAEVVAQQPLWLPSPQGSQSAWVRAASGLARFGEQIALIQDDTTAIIWLNADGTVLAQQSLEADGVEPKNFDALLGNKRLKPDLEAAVSFTFDRCEYWLAVGSGASAMRARAVMICSNVATPTPKWLSLQSWYERLSGCRDFSGAGLNIEGAFVLGQSLYLVQRGNGRIAGAVNAIAEFALAAVCAYLQDTRAAPPEILRIHPCNLGSTGGVAWGFADACVIGARVWFLLSAEDSPDTIADGAVLGTALAYCDNADFANLQMGQIADSEGSPVLLKLEGLCALDTRNLLAVSDDDDPTRPAQCLHLRLVADLWA